MCQSKRNVHRILSFLLVIGLVGAMGCATNPATGRQQLMLISEQQEVELGRQEHERTLTSYGVYENRELQEYVDSIGKRLANGSERAELPWTFTVLDDPSVNAMALPGGFVYITRGILAFMASEAELATVIGHEIGHVTARHSANQLSKAQIASIGLGIGSVLDTRFAGVSGLAEMGTAVLFLKFSRDDERQADDLGLRYMLREGYDAREAPKVFEMLDSVGQAGGTGRVPGWLSTHPAPENRSQRLSTAVASTGVDLSGSHVGRRQLFAQLDGLTFGEDPREGFFEDETFYHPELRFSMRFPPGWQVRNSRTVVTGLSPNKDAVVTLSLAEGESAKSAASRFARQSGIEAGPPRTGQVGGLSAARVTFEASNGQSAIAGRAMFVEWDGKTYQMLGYAASARWADLLRTIDSSLESFAVLADPVRLSVSPQTIEIVILERDMSMDQFQARYPSSVDLPTLGLLNRVAPEHVFRAGESVKRVVGGTHPPG